MHTLVCFALKEEAASFRKIAERKTGVAMLIVGIGRENAERAIREYLLTHTPELVLTCGFAGGLDPKLKIGDVLFEMPLKQLMESPRIISVKRLTEAGAKPAKFLCANRIATTMAEKQKLRSETGADVVEMESAAIHAVCAERNLPCVTLRVISDTAGEDLPLDFNVLSKPDKSLDFGKLAWAIARSPGKIGALMALQKKTSFAAAQLAATLDRITSA